MAARWAASSGRFNMPTCDQLANRHGVGDERLRNHDGVGGMKANGRVEIQQAAEIGRSDQDLGFGGLDIGLAAGELSGGSIRVGGPAQPRLEEVGREPGDRSSPRPEPGFAWPVCLRPGVARCTPRVTWRNTWFRTAIDCELSLTDDLSAGEVGEQSRLRH